MFSLIFHKAYAAITGPSSITSASGIGQIISDVITLVYALIGLALFGLLVAGGFTWLTSAGEPDKIKKAGDTMLNAVVGAGIVLLAYFLTRVVGGLFGFTWTIFVP